MKTMSLREALKMRFNNSIVIDKKKYKIENKEFSEKALNTEMQIFRINRNLAFVLGKIKGKTVRLNIILAS